MKSVSELLRDARQLHQRQRLDEAAQIYRELLRIRPSNAEVLTLLGEIRLSQGRIDEAATLLKKAATIDPAHARAHLYLGLSLIHQKKFLEAADALRSA